MFKSPGGVRACLDVDVEYADLARSRDVLHRGEGRAVEVAVHLGMLQELTLGGGGGGDKEEKTRE